MSTASEMVALERALRRHLGEGAVLVGATPLGGGANASSTRIACRVDGAEIAIVLRRSATAEPFSLNVPKSVEAAVQQSAANAGVPVADVRFVLDAQDELGDGYAMDVVEGDTRPAVLLGSESLRRRLGEQLGPVLAKIHSVPLEGLPAMDDVGVAGQLEALRAVYDDFDDPSATFEFAFRWLAGHLPAPRPAALVHGDFRMGNFMVGPGGLTAVLDWELCHLGDPIEDLGWCCVASWRFGRLDDRVGGVTDVETLRRGYVDAGGAPFTDDELRFWEVYGTLRWGVICMVQAFAHLRGNARSLERLAVGRRRSEAEHDLLRLLA